MASKDEDDARAPFTPSPQLRALGETLREVRDRQHVSQEALAAELKFHRNYIGRVERAELNVSFERLARIVDALGLRLSDVIALYEETPAGKSQASGAALKDARPPRAPR